MSIKHICGTFLSLATQSRFARLFLSLIFHVLFMFNLYRPLALFVEYSKYFDWLKVFCM